MPGGVLDQRRLLHAVAGRAAAGHPQGWAMSGELDPERQLLPVAGGTALMESTMPDEIRFQHGDRVRIVNFIVPKEVIELATRHGARQHARLPSCYMLEGKKPQV
jgi:hypothetical protein